MSNDPAADPVVGEALALAEGGDVSEATALLASEPDPIAAADVLQSLARAAARRMPRSSSNS